MATPKTAMPLALTLRRQLIWIAAAFAVSCLLLMLSFVLHSVELTTDSLTKLEAESIVRQAQRAPEQPLPQSHTLSAWRSWQDIPESIRQHFADKRLVPGETAEVEIRTATGHIEYLYLLHHEAPGFGTLYMASHHRADEIETAFTGLLGSALIQSLGVTLLILTVLFFVIAWLLRRTLEPLTLLSQWASQLNHQPEKAIDIEFPITELNQIAGQLRQGVDSVRAANEREQQFLKHASHELRTPLAVIQASLDTLDLQTEANSPANRSVQRALKASGRMIQLSDALLWLARETDKTISKETVDAQTLCVQLIDDHRYLLHPRTIEVLQRVSVTHLTIEAPLLSIVLANLIRNAFQHSSEGEILIELDADHLLVRNPVDNEHRSDEQGFGLGLQLVQRICRKLGWRFSFVLEQQEATVRVEWL